ncbi:MAG: peptidase M22 [Clostridia bacterium]|nr:peptidase M22 [Clostridia bacterium]
MGFLGIDTSNYTTSVAFYDNGEIFQQKMLLPVKEGEKGIRQSDAVFHHTKQYPIVLSALLSECGNNIEGVGVSVSPTTQEGSYMPCFLVGEGVAQAVSQSLGVPVFRFSHQQGHIAAALHSAGKTSFLEESFYAFHVSGGTTDMVLCEPSEEGVLKTIPIASSSDLKAGQAVDRIGVLMGLKFPAGIELERLALKSEKEFKNKIKLIDGKCSLSGLQNKCEKMLSLGESKEDVSKFLLTYISDSVRAMTDAAFSRYGQLPIIYAGGVMSNSIIQKRLAEQIPLSYFAQPQFSCDNAVGVAYLAHKSLKG